MKARQPVFPCSVVIATRNRDQTLHATLRRLEALPERPPIIVVDNASDDDTSELVRRTHPDVTLVELPENAGGAARNDGVRRAATPYVAFSDDDSWWAPGALTRAIACFERHRRLGLVAATILVGPERRVDPVCEAMRASPLPVESDLPGPSVLGFVAAGAIVRRDPFLDVGGFHPAFMIGGEERLLAIDLVRAGWAVCHVPDVVGHHHPSPSRDLRTRQRIQARNAFWTVWLRRRPLGVMRATSRLVRMNWRRPGSGAGLREAVAGLPWVLRERSPVDHELDHWLDATMAA